MPPDPTRHPSLLAWSAWGRLAAALALLVPLWLAVGWALEWGVGR